MSTIPNQSTACWPLSSHQHCFSYLLGKWCFLVPKNSFTEYFSRFLFSPTLSLYALNLRPKSPQKTLLLVQFFLLSWKEEKYVGEKFFLTYDRIIITTGICPKTFAPIYPHYKSFDSYIKPQLCCSSPIQYVRCISFDSYIKPQLKSLLVLLLLVVYLLIPTSNHNLTVSIHLNRLVVYLLIPTSNHNVLLRLIYKLSVVYLLIPTSNHNFSPYYSL